jgi:hypothetical protein
LRRTFVSAERPLYSPANKSVRATTAQQTPSEKLNREEIVMAQTDAIVSVPWYRTLNRDQWRVLIASNLGWAFDGFEIYALFLTVAFALHQLLDAAQYAAIPRYAGYILATTVFGWATGGVIGGIIADYIGRKRTMMLAILAYSLTTGLSAFA